MSAELIRQARRNAEELRSVERAGQAAHITELADALESAEAQLASISAAREKAKATVSGRLAFTDQVRHILEGKQL